jgi:hypothetical protein
MGYIDAHVHVWTPDTAHYLLAAGFKKEDMKPASLGAASGTRRFPLRAEEAVSDRHLAMRRRAGFVLERPEGM